MSTYLFGILYVFIANILLITGQNNEFYCFEPSHRNELKYENAPNTTMYHLPTMRLIQGFWNSQWALQYAAYIYLKEKIGISVEWFPKQDSDNIDPEILFDYSYIEGDEYPLFYWNWIQRNEYDLLFEMWPGTSEHADLYYANGSVLYVGTPGDVLFGEIGWFVPQYMVENNFNVISPLYLNENDTLKQMFIEAYTNLSDINWIEYFNENEEEIYKSDLKHDQYKIQYTKPTYNKPIIWGSNPTYFLTIYSHNLTKHLFNGAGIDYDFVPLGSEATLTEFVIDLYSKRLPFIANIYSPSIDFAFRLPNGEVPKFDRIALPRNPSNSVRDECYTERYTCKQPVFVLFKLANPRLRDTFPEMLEFIEQFQMITTDVNDIILRLDELKNTSISLDEKWKIAACKWLKNNSAITRKWDVTIKRYECIGGCGFNYFYDENNAKNMINDTLSHVLGECDFSTGKCFCDYKELYDDCTKSCPGRSGPFKINNSYTIISCNNNGICDPEFHSCSCYIGYGGDDCSVKYTHLEYNKLFMIIFLSIYFVMIIILILSILWLVTNRKHSTVKRIAGKMSVMFTVGLILLCIVNIINLLYTKSNTFSCNLIFWLGGIAMILTIAAPLLKIYRVAMIFAAGHKLGSVNIQDEKLFAYLMIFIVIQIIINAAYTTFYFLGGGIKTIYIEEYYRIQNICNNEYTQLISYIDYGYFSFLLLLLAYYSILTEKKETSTKLERTKKQLRESRCTYFGSFFAIFVFIVIFSFNIVTDDQSIIITMLSFCCLVVIAFVWILFFAKRIYVFYKEKRMENSTVKQTTVSIQQNHSIHQSDNKAKNNDDLQMTKTKKPAAPQQNNIVEQEDEQSEFKINEAGINNLMNCIDDIIVDDHDTHQFDNKPTNSGVVEMNTTHQTTTIQQNNNTVEQAKEQSESKLNKPFSTVL